MKEQIQANSKNDIVEYIQFIRETENVQILRVEIRDVENGYQISTGISIQNIECAVEAIINIFGNMTIEGHKISTKFDSPKKEKRVTLQLKTIE